MSDLRNLAEFERRYALTLSFDGLGVDTKIHCPCPFCAHADFWIYRLIDLHDALSRRAFCVNCGRAARVIFTFENGEQRAEIVQTSGPDQPEWLQPKMRRV